MKPYQQIPIQDCGEPLVPISGAEFALVEPSSLCRAGSTLWRFFPLFPQRGEFLAALIQAQKSLQEQHPGWRIQVFDAFRPVAVQQFYGGSYLSGVVQGEGADSQKTHH